MIQNFSIRQFKAFRQLELQLRPLTVLTGLNNAGKSSIIQAMILAHLASQADAVVPLNGPYGLALGEALDVLNAEATDQTIELAVRRLGDEDRFRLHVPDDRRMALEIESTTRSQGIGETGYIDAYLSAERLGPRDYLDIPPIVEGERSVGHRGQFTAYVLASLDRLRIEDNRLHPLTASTGIAPTLAPQTEAWLSSIAGSVQIQADWPETMSVATLRFKDDPKTSTSWKRAANVGFGFSYVLPVVVAGLISRPDRLLIVENPEAHLHPAGQSKIGEFLARVASAGVQVLVETHSDHVLNGIRLASAADDVLPPSDVSFQFFEGNGRSTEIRLTPSGGLTSWPKGFFDQLELDLSRISRLPNQ